MSLKGGQLKLKVLLVVLLRFDN